MIIGYTPETAEKIKDYIARNKIEKKLIDKTDIEIFTSFTYELGEPYKGLILRQTNDFRLGKRTLIEGKPGNIRKLEIAVGLKN
jgi:hypothetical protein